MSKVFEYVIKHITLKKERYTVKYIILLEAYRPATIEEIEEKKA